MTPPPVSMRLTAVPAYLKEHYALDVTERTVRNWATIGLRNETLETRQVKNPQPTQRLPFIKVTTVTWLDEFLQRCHINVTRTP